MTAVLAPSDPVLTEFAELVGVEDPVAVEGGRTRWSVGGELVDGTRVIEAPTGIVEYQPEEMTITVRAGTTVAELDVALAERGQRSALVDRDGTVGGALAVGENDIRALGRGTIRSAPLQVRYVSAEGRIVTSGGPTVKNVSGFDLPRLLVGSLGTLGLLAEVTLRTNPVPPVSVWYSAEGADPRAVLDALLAPSCVLWDGTTTWVQLEGHQPDVAAEREALDVVGSFAEVGGPPELPPHRHSVTPAAALRAPGETRQVAIIGLGLVFSEEPAPPRPLEPALAELHRRLKDNFDPTGRLNPGRDAGAR